MITDKLKLLFAKVTNQAAFIAYQNFETFQRPETMSIIGYINKFELLNAKITKYGMTLPTGVLAYQLLKNANISLEKQQLIHATIENLNYENMTFK